MRCGYVFIALLLVMLCALAASADPVPSVNAPRDGRWLQAGIKQYEAMQETPQNAHTPAQIDDALGAAVLVGYLRGVIDLEKLLASRAHALTGKVTEARDEKRVSREWANGSNDGMFILMPLEKSGFIDNKYQLDQYIQTLKNYLEKHPLKWDEDAATLIEFALWDAFPQKKD